MVDPVETEATEPPVPELAWDGIGVSRSRQAAVKSGVETGPLREFRGPVTGPGQSFQRWRIVQRRQGDQLLQGGFHLGCDPGGGREALAAMDHAVTNQGHLLTMGFQGWGQPAVQHRFKRFIRSHTAAAVPGAGPGGIHQGRLEAGTAEVDHQRQIAHQRTSQVISTLRGSTFQMFLQYSPMDRSEEKNPVRAVFSSDMRFQCMRSVQARLTASWARR